MSSTPQASVIIPYFDQRKKLPRLLDSIFAQEVPDLEIVVVKDDAGGQSGEDLENLLAPYKDKGADLRLIQEPERQYVENCRLTGVAAARAEIILFADATDTLYGDGSLEHHLTMMRKSGADILHFQYVQAYEDGRPTALNRRAGPFANILRDSEVFATFVKNRLPGPEVWNKLYSRQLWLEILDFARTRGVRRYQEDLFLACLLMFHARRYVGSARPGYRHLRQSGAVTRSAGRASTCHAILQELVPYLGEKGCAPELVAEFERIVRDTLRVHVERLCLAARDREQSFDVFLETLQEIADFRTFLEIFLMTFPPKPSLPEKPALTPPRRR